MIFRLPEHGSGQRRGKRSRIVSVVAPGLAFLLGCANKPAAEDVARQQLSRAEVFPEIIAEVELANPSAFVRDDSPVYLSYYDLGLAQADARLSRLSGLVRGAVVPSQHVDDDADGVKDGVVLLVSFRPGETLKLELVADGASQPSFPKRTHAEIAHKMGGEWRPRAASPALKEYVGGTFQNVSQFTPPPEHADHSNLIRYEGPGIESDKVGYRIYLDQRNGFDIFGKKTPEVVLSRVGLDGYESYHQMADWGMDILKVGLSLGAGGFGFYDGERVQLVSEVSGWDATIVEDGPVYSAFSIKYKGWRVGGKQLDARATFSMLAGSRRVHTRVALSDSLPRLAVGVVKHPGAELVLGSTNLPGKAHTYLGSWGQQSLSGDQLGMAVLFERGALTDSGAVVTAAQTAPRDRTAPATPAADTVAPLADAQSHAVALEPVGTELSYHFLAAWQGEPGGIQTKEAFARYLEEEAERLTFEPRQRLQTQLSKRAKVFPLTAESARDWAKKLADSELERKTLSYRFDGWDRNRGRKPKFEYDVVGLQPLAYEELNRVSPDPRYARVVEQVTGSYVTDEGNIREYDEHDYNIDSVAPGRNLLSLFVSTRQEKYKQAAGLIRRQLERHPKTSEGAFWHKKRYPWQLWLDGVYMGMPFLAAYSTLFEQGGSLDEVVSEFVIARRHLRDPKTGLYFHAWDEKRQQAWADPATGLSKHFWGRGLGWFSMALVDVLEQIPEGDEKHRAPLLEMVNELAPALVAFQDRATHTWWQIMDQPGAVGNYRESTASAMFSYFFAKAVRKGYLPASFKDTATASYQGVIEEFITVHPDGKISMSNQCLVAGLGYGRDGSYRYYMSEPVWKNDPKGNGPFILAGVEVSRLLGG